MRKSLLFAAFATLTIFVSCQKDDLSKDYTVKDPVFTATIENSGTKTTIDAVNAKVAWVEGDEITITDASSTSVKYVVSNIDAQGKATFTKDPNETQSLGAGPYTAVYGTAPSTVQTYSTSAPSLPMSAPSTSSTEFTFTVTCGLLEITLQKSEEVIKFIDVSDGTNTYILKCSEGVSIGSGAKFYLAVPEATYSSFVFTNSSNRSCVKSGLSIQVASNHIKPISSTNLSFNALRGAFTVNSEGKKVHFSPGNLYCRRTSSTSNDWEWHFYDQQYDYLSQTSATANDLEIDLFTWGYSANSVNPVTESYLTSFSDWGDATEVQETIGSGWKTISEPEWSYLFSTRTVNGGTKEGYTCKRATINSDLSGGVYGLILYPDGYTSQSTSTSYTASDWSIMEADGCVFLPSAGYRAGSTVTQGNSTGGFCWTSTFKSAATDAIAYTIWFSTNRLKSGSHACKTGRSVRLVRE